MHTVKATLVASLLFHSHVEKKLLSIYFFKYTLHETFYSFSILFKYTYFIILSHLNIIFFIHSLSFIYYFVVDRGK